MLRKVISGCQNGADQAGLYVAKKYGIETGGWIPKGWKTLNGSKPEFGPMYNIQQFDWLTILPLPVKSVLLMPSITIKNHLSMLI